MTCNKKTFHVKQPGDVVLSTFLLNTVLSTISFCRLERVSFKTQPKSTESRNFSLTTNFHFFLSFSKWIQNGASDMKIFAGLSCKVRRNFANRTSESKIVQNGESKIFRCEFNFGRNFSGHCILNLKPWKCFFESKIHFWFTFQRIFRLLFQKWNF